MKKMAWIVLWYVLMTTSTVLAQNQALTFAQTQEKSQNENKKILLYFSGSDWCAPCIKFKKKYIQVSDFQTFADKNLILFNVDFPRLKKNKLSNLQMAENENLAEKYNIDGLFPLILLLDSKGNILKKWEGCPKESLSDFINNLQ